MTSIRTIPADGGVTLAAWLYKPDGAGPFPAIRALVSSDPNEPAFYSDRQAPLHDLGSRIAAAAAADHES
jgi:hypothetical protein